MFLNNAYKGTLLSKVIERGEEGNYFRVMTFKNTRGGEPIKEAILVTSEIIQSEIDRINTQITKLQDDKDAKQQELDEITPA